jgi:hypothetical protein
MPSGVRERTAPDPEAGARQDGTSAVYPVLAYRAIRRRDIDPACAGAGAVTTVLGYICAGPPGATVHVYYDNVRTQVQ